MADKVPVIDNKQASTGPNELIIFVVSRFALTLAKTFGTAWLLISLWNHFFGYKPLENTKSEGVCTLLLYGIVVSLLHVAIGLYQRASCLSDLLESYAYDDGKSTQSSAGTQAMLDLVSDLNGAYSAHKWTEVIKLGSVLSRPLWTTGKHKLRLEIGDLVGKAASFSKDYMVQSTALIDDIGWTLAAMKNYGESRKSIEHGIKVAVRHNYHDIACKGYRHLSAIAIRSGGSTADAYEYAKKAEDCLPLIQELKKKDEMAAGLHYMYAVIHKHEKMYPQALEELDQALSAYQLLGDRDREVKTFSLRGNILLEQGDPDTACDVFREGLSFARELSRSDEIINNCIGIAMIAAMNNDLTSSREAYAEAIEVAEKKMKNQVLANELRGHIGT